MKTQTLVAVLTALSLARPQAADTEPSPLPGTATLAMDGDIASRLVAGVDRFLLRKIAQARQDRASRWKELVETSGDRDRALDQARQRLARMLGVRDDRPERIPMRLDAPVPGQIEIARTPAWTAFAVRWPAFGAGHGEGLLLRPEPLRDASPGTADDSNAVSPPGVPFVLAIPDADQTPEEIAGLAPGLPARSQFARRLADRGCLVLIPTLIDRAAGDRQLPNREFVYRPAFELGRHIAGYEVQKILAALDWHTQSSAAWGIDRSQIGLAGYGEGGRLALFAAALDGRVASVWTSGSFGPQESVWEEPIDRNVFGLLELFGDAELAAMIAPRTVVVEACRAPEIVVPRGGRAAPGRLLTPPRAEVEEEFARARALAAASGAEPSMTLVGDGYGPFGDDAAMTAFLAGLDFKVEAQHAAEPVEVVRALDAADRHGRQLDELDRHTQWLLVESPYARRAFLRDLDTGSGEAFQRTANEYREYFADQVIGRFADPLLPPQPRSRKALETASWTGYEIVLDVFEDVIAYGILLIPKDLWPGEHRPVVVCQHGLEGRPRDIVAGDHPAYHDFAAKLCERGFVTFAPQNLYIFGDRFRTLQRKANPLGKTLFSIIVPQHQQLTDWLKTLPFVDPDRIGFYGLSYGGKTAMRVPALVGNYCLSICSADFNEWIWKNASTRSPYSYVWTGEYEIFEFDLGNTFNYAEMAALIAPRPFMVERGHFDGVAPDETVAYEFAKVRHLYAAKLGIPERCQIEWFVGPHTINGQGTFEFLHRHLALEGPGHPTRSGGR